MTLSAISTTLAPHTGRLSTGCSGKQPTTPARSLFERTKAIDGNRRPNSDPHRKRCKQAEFLVYRQTSWSAIRGIAVCNAAAEARVLAIQANHPTAVHRPVSVTPAWYF